MPSRSSSCHVASLVLVAIVGCLASCSTTTQEQSGAELRKEGYETLLKTIKPGMYRRQLYAVLPPYRKPMARPPVLGGAIFMLPSIPGRESHWAHQEKHELDEECWVVVNYQLKNGKEYPPPPASNARTIDDALVEATSPAPPQKAVSKENPDDVIFSISEVLAKRDTGETSEHEFSTYIPTQEHGIVFGRQGTSEREFWWMQGATATFRWKAAAEPPDSEVFTAAPFQSKDNRIGRKQSDVTEGDFPFTVPSNSP